MSTPKDGYYIATVQCDTGEEIGMHVQVKNGTPLTRRGQALVLSACGQFTEVSTGEFCRVWYSDAALELEALRAANAGLVERVRRLEDGQFVSIPTETTVEACPHCGAGVLIVNGKECRAASKAWVMFDCLTSIHRGRDPRMSQSQKCEEAERERLIAEIAALRTANAGLVDRVKWLEATIENIREYWNRDNNPKAMEDACWYAINAADEALESKEAKP